MESVLGGGVLLAIAAALWIVYLVPNWLRRSEYLATERNAVRLQQTIRVLAETAETPEAVRIENEAAARRLAAELAAAQASERAASAQGVRRGHTPGARLRRTRMVTTVIIAAAAAAVVSQTFVAFAVGAQAVSWPLVVGGVGLGGAGLWLQGRLAAVARSRRPRVAGPRAAARSAQPTAAAFDEASAPAVAASREWTPTPLPEPLHRVRQQAALRAALEREVAAARRERDAERAVARAAQVAQAAEAAEPQATDVPRPRPAAEPTQSQPRRLASVPAAAVPAVSRPSSRFAAMGVVERPGAAPDIDAAIARRRAS